MVRAALLLLLMLAGCAAGHPEQTPNSASARLAADDIPAPALNSAPRVFEAVEALCGARYPVRLSAPGEPERDAEIHFEVCFDDQVRARIKHPSEPEEVLIIAWHTRVVVREVANTMADGDEIVSGLVHGRMTRLFVRHLGQDILNNALRAGHGRGGVRSDFVALQRENAHLSQPDEAYQDPEPGDRGFIEITDSVLTVEIGPESVRLRIDVDLTGREALD